MFQQGSPATFLAGWTAGGERRLIDSTPSTVGVVAMRSILCMIIRVPVHGASRVLDLR
jgi:hypothetical protein